MSLEDQIAALTVQLTRIADSLAAGATTNASSTTSGSKPAGKPANKAPATEKPKPEAQEPATEPETAEKTPAENNHPVPDKLTFDKCSQHFFAYLTHARNQLGRNEAKAIARQLIDQFQTEPGKPLSTELLPEESYNDFYRAVSQASQELAGDE